MSRAARPCSACRPRRRRHARRLRRGDDDDSIPAHLHHARTRRAADDAAARRTSRPPGSRSRGRCEANKAAGTITYLSGFDFAASASIVDVMSPSRGLLRRALPRRRAEAQLLDRQLPDRRRRRGPVRVRRLVQRGRRLRHGQRRRRSSPSTSTAHGHRQPDHQAGRGSRRSTDLEGKTIGVKGKFPPSVEAMLAGAGLGEGTDYQTVPLDGLRPDRPLRPRRHRRLPRLQEQRAGPARPGRASRSTCSIPTKFDVPGSFGVFYTNAGVRRRPPDGRAGLRAGDDAGPRGRPRRPGRRHGGRDRTSSRPTATRASCRSRASTFRWRTERADHRVHAAETGRGPDRSRGLE